MATGHVPNFDPDRPYQQVLYRVARPAILHLVEQTLAVPVARMREQAKLEIMRLCKVDEVRARRSAGTLVADAVFRVVTASAIVGVAHRTKNAHRQARLQRKSRKKD